MDCEVLPEQPKAYLFTKANAREMNAKSQEAKRLRLEELRNAAKPETLAQAPDFEQTRCLRMRARLIELDSSLAELTAMPPLTKGREAAIKAVASALRDLQEQERQLAGRPLPPTLKGEVRAQVKTRAAQLLSGE